MHSDRDVGAGIMYLYGRWNDTNFPPTDSFRGKTSSSSSSSFHSTHLLSWPSSSLPTLETGWFPIWTLSNGQPPTSVCTTSNFLVYNLQHPCVQPPTSLCTISNFLVYNLQLPCVQPPTSLCTTSNFLLQNLQLYIWSGRYFPSGIYGYIVFFRLFPKITSFSWLMSDISVIPVTLQRFSYWERQVQVLKDWVPNIGHCS